jgi:hypothetical protein
MIHRVYAARYLKRLFGRHKLLTPEIVELLKLSETSRADRRGSRETDGSGTLGRT